MFWFFVARSLSRVQRWLKVLGKRMCERRKDVDSDMVVRPGTVKEKIVLSLTFPGTEIVVE